MDKLDKYWRTYDSGTSTSDAHSYIGDLTEAIGYICPNCGQWVRINEYHSCYPYHYTWYYYPTVNKTEQAFKILKKLVEEKVIREPQSFKKFCDLIEKIAGVI